MHIEPALSGSETLAKPFLFAAVAKEIEREDALMIRGALKHFRMTQGANGVPIACAPVLLHAGAREVVVLRVTRVVSGAVGQVRSTWHATSSPKSCRRLQVRAAEGVPRRLSRVDDHSCGGLG